MQTKIGRSGAPLFGGSVAAAYELNNRLAPDRPAAAELAVRHVQRLLIHGRNAALVAALPDLDRVVRVGPVARKARRALATLV